MKPFPERSPSRRRRRKRTTAVVNHHHQQQRSSLATFSSAAYLLALAIIMAHRATGFQSSLTDLSYAGWRYQPSPVVRPRRNQFYSSSSTRNERTSPSVLGMNMRSPPESTTTPTTDDPDAGTDNNNKDDQYEYALESDRLLIPLETTTSSPSLANAAVADKKNHGTTKRTILFLLWTTAWLSALDRVAMSVALLPISAEFHYTDAVKGSISSLFSVGYGLAIIPAGLLVANKACSPRLIMAGGLVIWSLSTLATPAAISMTDTMIPLLMARACVGVGESVILPTIQKLLQAWMLPNEKSLALAVIISGFQAGTISAYLLSPVVMEVLGGWQSLFYVYGGAGLLILVPWLLLAKDRPETEEIVLLAESKETELKSQSSSSWDASLQSFRDAPWKEFTQSKAVWAIMLTHCSKNWSLYCTLAWTPIFYSEQYGIGVRDSAWLSVLPSIAGAAGGFVAGYVADSIIQKLKDNDVEGIGNVRKLFQGLSQYGPALAYGALALHIPEEPWAAQTFLMAAVGLMSFGAAGNEVSLQEKAGEKWVGLLYSVTSLPAVMVGTFGVYVTGQVLDLTGQDWSYVFGLNAIVNVLGATAFLTLYDSKREFE